MSKRFLVSSLSFLKIKQSDCVLQFVFGLAYWKAFDSFRHYIVQGLAQMRIGTKYLLDCRSSRLVSGFHPLSFGSSPPLSRLWARLLRHPAFPLVHQLFRWDSYIPFIIWSYIYICYADLMLRTQSPWNTRLLLLVLFIDAGLGTTLGGY